MNAVIAFPLAKDNFARTIFTPSATTIKQFARGFVKVVPIASPSDRADEARVNLPPSAALRHGLFRAPPVPGALSIWSHQNWPA